MLTGGDRETFGGHRSGWRGRQRHPRGNEERSRHYSIYSASGQAVPSTKTVLVVSQFRRRLGATEGGQGGGWAQIGRLWVNWGRRQCLG